MSDIQSKEFEQLEADMSRPNRGIVATQDFVDPQVLYDELINRILKYHPNTDISMIQKAYRIANEAHNGQVRKSGEPYISHPLCVAIILADIRAPLRSLRSDKICNIRRSSFSKSSFPSVYASAS